MVLLTSSTVTVLLSSALVTTFTFLLFLSGYVLQQQTVAQLQLALHPPPLPTPTLPVYFSDVEVNETAPVEGQGLMEGGGKKENVGPVLAIPESVKGSSKQEVLQFVKDAVPDFKEEETLTLDSDEPASLSMDSSSELKPELVPVSQQAIDNTEKPSSELTQLEEQPPFPIAEQAHHAMTIDLVEPSRHLPITEEAEIDVIEDSPLGYVLLAPTPPLICSAIMFFSHLSFSKSVIPNRLLLYPSFWEDSPVSDAYATALALLKSATHEHGIMVQPIQLPSDHIVEDLSPTEIEQAMLATVVSGEWTPVNSNLTTLFYVRSPGLLLKAQRLDSVLNSFATSPLPTLDSNVPQEWTPLPTATSDSILSLPSGLVRPSHLLISLPEHERPQLFLPTSRGTKSLVLPAMTSHSNNHASEMEIEAQAMSSGYVLFSEDQLKHRRGESQWYGGIFERFERGRREVCPEGLDDILEDKVGKGRRIGKGNGRGNEDDKARGW